MRLFVAVAPPSAVLGHLDAACAPLRREHPELRWSGPELQHLTLAFLGEVAEDRLEALAPRLERAARRHRACPLSLAGGGAFPGPASGTVLWAGVSGDRRVLEGLAQSVQAGARRAGAAPPDDGRRFRPHLTLARSRTAADLRPLVAVLAGYQGPEWTAGVITLFASHAGAGAPRYEALFSWGLS
jgi:2'-5' RNA ligase